MMPFPELELVKTRIEELHRRAERERVANEALARRPRRDRMLSALFFARSLWRRVRSGVRVEASSDQIQPELDPLLRVSADQQVDRTDGVREPVCR
jgi:hypothetical protein